MLPRFLILVCAVVAATPAHAQDRVAVELEGVPPGVPVEIFMSGARADHTVAGATSTSAAADFMSAGKSADIAIDRCRDGVSVSVVEDGRLFPPEPDDCDNERTIIENVTWQAGRPLVIDVRRGVIVPPTTIGNHPDVQAAARGVLTALRNEPRSTDASGGTTATVVELASVPDSALATWIPRFRDQYAAVGSQGASNTTLAAMEQLLNVVAPLYERRTGNSARPVTPVDSTTVATPTTAILPPLSFDPAARDFRVEVSGEYTLRLRGGTTNASPPAATPPTSLSGRVWNAGGAIAREPRFWYYGVGSGTAIGATDSGSAIIRNPLHRSSIEIREVLMPRDLSGMQTLLGPIPDQIIRNTWWLNRIVMRSALRDAIDIRARAELIASTARLFPRMSIQQSDQGQVSLIERQPGSTEFFGRVGLPQVLLAARSSVDAIRLAVVPGARSAAISAPGVRLAVGPRGRREYWIEPMQSAAAQAQAAGEEPRPSLKVFIRSLGRSTGENAQQAIFINDGNVPVRVMESEEFATEPLEGVSEQAFAKELEQYAGRPRMTMDLASYCLDFKKAAPTKGRVYRVAAIAEQDRLAPVRRILRSSQQLRDAGQLHPDGDPNLYFHSVRQWAIWTVEQRFNERTFAEALLEYTKKNVQAAGRRWTKEIEQAARSIIPNRWQDVQRVVAASR
jgi:hypothetical protein